MQLAPSGAHQLVRYVLDVYHQGGFFYAIGPVLHSSVKDGWRPSPVPCIGMGRVSMIALGPEGYFLPYPSRGTSTIPLQYPIQQPSPTSINLSCFRPPRQTTHTVTIIHPPLSTWNGCSVWECCGSLYSFRLCWALRKRRCTRNMESIRKKPCFTV